MWLASWIVPGNYCPPLKRFSPVRASRLVPNVRLTREPQLSVIGPEVSRLTCSLMAYLSPIPLGAEALYRFKEAFHSAGIRSELTCLS